MKEINQSEPGRIINGRFQDKKAVGNFDLAVLGGGPAGALSAIIAAEAGLKTVILERKKIPRPKICGGFISLRALSLLPDDLDLQPGESEAISTIKIITGHREYCFSSAKILGRVIKRDYFDQELLNYAASRGVTIVENTALRKNIVTGESETGSSVYQLMPANNFSAPFETRYIIGADGALGSSGRLSGLRKTQDRITGWGLSAIVTLGTAAVEPGTIIFYPLPFRGGMGWSFNGPGFINRGVGGLASRRVLLESFFRLFPEMKEFEKPKAWPLPFLGPLKRVSLNNLLLVGDAAGLVEPYSGEGLYNSLKSAILAATAVVKAEENSQPAGELYQELYKKHFSGNFFAALTGAFLLHGRSILAPATMPPVIAALMQNRLWFNRDLHI